MPVVTVRHGDMQASVLLQAGSAMTSDGLWIRPFVYFQGGESSYDSAWLARVPWGRCTRIQRLGPLLIITCQDDQNRNVFAMFDGSRQEERIENQVLLRRLYLFFKRIIRKASNQRRLAMGMSMHPRLGAGSWLAGLGDNVLTLVVRQIPN